MQGRNSISFFRAPSYDFPDGPRDRNPSIRPSPRGSIMNARDRTRGNAMPRIIVIIWCAMLPATSYSVAGEPARVEPAAERGYRRLTETAYLPPDFDQEVFENLWKIWPAEVRDA